jgi:hypothetical protein
VLQPAEQLKAVFRALFLSTWDIWGWDVSLGSRLFVYPWEEQSCVIAGFAMLLSKEWSAKNLKQRKSVNRD